MTSQLLQRLAATVRLPVLAYSRTRPCCSYQGHLVKVTGWSAEWEAIPAGRGFHLTEVALLFTLTESKLVPVQHWQNLRHRTDCASTQHYAPPPHTQPFYSSLDFVRDNLGEPVPEGTIRHLLDSNSQIRETKLCGTFKTLKITNIKIQTDSWRHDTSI